MGGLSSSSDSALVRRLFIFDTSINDEGACVGRGKKIVDIELVVREAIALIEEGGVEEFSTRRLASRLGISAMTLYNYYENRGAILKGVLRTGLGLLWMGLDEEVAAWRGGGGSPLGAYRVLADHLLAFAQARPSLCRFILTESAGVDWSAIDGRIEQICAEGADWAGVPRTERLRRDVYLFELLAFALTLKVIGGGESPERYRELTAEGYELLLGRHEAVTA
jgi:AcrR family transcriptional regulator